MARSMEPDTAESQWYITDGAQPGLDEATRCSACSSTALMFATRSHRSRPGPRQWMEFTFEDVPIEDVVVEAAYCVLSWP